MKTATVTYIDSLGALELKHGTFYKYKLTLDNGDSGEYLSKKDSTDQLTFKVLDKIEYELLTNDYGNRIKNPRKPGTGFVSGGKSFGEPFEVKIIGFAASYAKDLIVADKAELKDMRSVADAFYDYMISKYKDVTSGGES